jgi:hypothetical protein
MGHNACSVINGWSGGLTGDAYRTNGCCKAGGASSKNTYSYTTSYQTLLIKSSNNGFLLEKPALSFFPESAMLLMRYELAPRLFLASYLTSLTQRSAGGTHI